MTNEDFSKAKRYVDEAYELDQIQRTLMEDISALIDNVRKDHLRLGQFEELEFTLRDAVEAYFKPLIQHEKDLFEKV